jgi:hypothetical protein
MSETDDDDRLDAIDYAFMAMLTDKPETRLKCLAKVQELKPLYRTPPAILEAVETATGTGAFAAKVCRDTWGHLDSEEPPPWTPRTAAEVRTLVGMVGVHIAESDSAIGEADPVPVPVVVEIVE